MVLRFGLKYAGVNTRQISSVSSRRTDIPKVPVRITDTGSNPATYGCCTLPVLNPTLTCEAGSAGAAVFVQGGESASATVQTGVGVAGVGDGYLAERGRVADGAGAPEGGTAAVERDAHVTSAAVLAARTGASVARVGVLAVLSYIHGRTAVTNGHTRVSKGLYLGCVQLRAKGKKNKTADNRIPM